MKTIKTIGTYDANGQKKEVPNYSIGAVLNWGEDLPLGKNVDYVNAKGNYDIVEFLIDHCEAFKSLYNFAVGKLELQKTTELDCEYLFS